MSTAGSLSFHGRCRFISDLHLRAERPDLNRRLLTFLADTRNARCEALFILGDLFEYWIGDDDMTDSFNASVIQALRETSDAGVRLYFTCGNRDFLLGERFATAAGVIRLEDTTRIDLHGVPTLLIHGDLVCTDDLPYQNFRKLVRSERWQTDFLARPLAERQAEVANLRRRSAEAMAAKSAAIMDANRDAAIRLLHVLGCRRLIHGHTHRPGMEILDAGPPPIERWVLSDWDRGRGDALEATGAGLVRLKLPD